MRGRHNNALRESYPGPGAYEHKDTNSGIATVFKSKRFPASQNTVTPGPGEYDVKDPKLRQWHNRSVEGLHSKEKSMVSTNEKISQSGFGIAKRLH